MTPSTVLLSAAALAVLPGARVRLASLRQPSRSFVDLRSRTAGLVLIGAASIGSITAVGGVSALCAAMLICSTAALRRRKANRRRAYRLEFDSLAAGLEMVIGELRVGAHPALACANAAEDCTGSAAAAFGAASGRARLGGDAYAGLRDPDSLVVAELGRLAVAWQVADRHGLGLVGLLGASRHDMLARRRFRDRTEAGLAGARATGTVLACLPVLGVILGQMMGASPIGVLLGGGLGGILLLLGSAFACAGLLWTDAIAERACR